MTYARFLWHPMELIFIELHVSVLFYRVNRVTLLEGSSWGEASVYFCARTCLTPPHTLNSGNLFCAF